MKAISRAFVAMSIDFVVLQSSIQDHLLFHILVFPVRQGIKILFVAALIVFIFKFANFELLKTIS